MAENGIDPAMDLAGNLMELTTDQAVKLTRELCAQLIEDGGAFHGNIWPGSVTVDEDGRARLGEGSDAPVSGRTASQVEYLSPEYFWDNEGTAASDVYSLGLLLYAGCNDGYLPFQPKGGALTDKDRSGALRKRMKGEELVLPAGVSEELGAVLQKALAYEPEDRYADPAALLAALSETDEALPAAEAVGAAAAAAATTLDEFDWGTEPASSDEPAEEEVRENGTEFDEPEWEQTEELPDRDLRDELSAEPEDGEAKEEPERKYTVQKDFEKKRGGKAGSAAPTTFRKKKASPVIPVLCIAAAAVILGGVWYALNHRAPAASPTLDLESREVSEPVVVLPAESPEATEAPKPQEEIHTISAAELNEDEKDGEASEEPEDAGDEAESEDAEPAVGSESIDGMDVTAASDTVYVTGSGVNLRAGPGTSYDVKMTLPRGTKLQRTGTVNGWSQVQYQGKEYYVSSSLVSTDAPEGTETETVSNDKSSSSSTSSSTGSTTLTVTSDVNVRTGPGIGYSILGVAKKGATFTSSGLVDGKWYRVEYNGKEGYVNRKLVSASTSSGTSSTSSSSSTNSSTVNKQSGKLEVISKANIRSGPGTGYSILGTADVGATLTMTGHTDSNWYEINYDGKTGYIAGNLVKTVS